MGSMLNDVRVAFRSLLKSPGFLGVTVLTLAVAIGANTAIYSVVEGVLLRPLPYRQPDDLVIVRAGLRNPIAGLGEGITFSDRGFWHFVENNQVYETFGGFNRNPVPLPLTGDGPPIQVNGGQLTLSTFELLGVQPQRGRFPTAEEDVPDAPRVVLLSDGLWKDRFGQDPGVIGRTIELNGEQWEVIGIMPPGFDFPSPEFDLWTPYRLNRASENFGGHHIEGIGRLAPGTSIEAAVTDAEGLIGRFGEVGYGESWFTGVFDGTAHVTRLKDRIIGDSRQPLMILFGTVAFVLLIACSNVANLLLVRAEGRTRESAVRLALGSGRRRLIQQVFIESLLLAFLGGVVGVGLALVGTRALVAAGPASIPRLGDIHVDAPVLGFTAAVSILAGLLFGVFPALRAGSRKSLSALKDGARGSTIGRERHRVRGALVVTQVALALVLVVGSGLMVRSFQQLRKVEPGFRSAGVLTFGLRPPVSKYGGAEGIAQFYDNLLAALEDLPSVDRAGAITLLPLEGSGAFLTRVIEEFPPPEGEFPPAFYIRRATPGYFEAMGIPVVEGRSLTPDDHNLRLGSMVISNSLKQRYWPDVSAIGKRISGANIVGVVGDVRGNGLDSEPDEYIYYPMLDSVGGGVSAMTVAVRANTDPRSIAPEVRRVVSELDPDLPISDVTTMSDVVGDSLSRTSFTMALLVLAAILSLFLGSVGIYGVISYIVSQRTGEIGVRLALGADPQRVRGMVLRQGMGLAGAGVVLGLAGAIALGGVLRTLLYGVTPTDPAALVAGPLVFLGVAALASFLPARRASMTAPAEALRGE